RGGGSTRLGRGRGCTARAGRSARATSARRKASSGCNGAALPACRRYTRPLDRNRESLMRSSLVMLVAAVAVGGGCSPESTPVGDDAARPDAGAPAPSTFAEHDPLSYAEPEKARIEHLALELELSFEKKELAGSATYRLDWRDPNATELVLDSRDLAIERVAAEQADGSWSDLEYVLADPVAPLGSKLTIRTPGQPERVRVSYRTSPEASGLQWLTPAMTQGGKQPFMFSQSQQIHARSWVPLQDTPSV